MQIYIQDKQSRRHLMVDVRTDEDLYTGHKVSETFHGGRTDGRRSIYRTYSLRDISWWTYGRTQIYIQDIQSRRHFIVDVLMDVDLHTGHTVSETSDSRRIDGCRSTYRTYSLGDILQQTYGCTQIYIQDIQSRRHFIVDVLMDVDPHTGHTVSKTFYSRRIDGRISTYRTCRTNGL